MRRHYWAVKPKGRDDLVRFECAPDAAAACRQAFSRGLSGFLVKDLGGRVEVLRSDRKRRAALADPFGWVELKGWR
jgi:hypothetical protein